MKTFLGSVLSAALAAGAPAALAQTKTVQPPSSLELRRTPVTRAVELSVQARGTGDLIGVRTEVDVVVAEMEALRSALDDLDTSTPHP